MTIRYLNTLYVYFLLVLVVQAGELLDDGKFIDLYKLYEEHVQRQKDEKQKADHQRYVEETQQSFLV